MTRAVLAALALALLSPLPAAAYCETSTTQNDMNVCAGATFDAADKELNALYGQMRARLKGDDATRALLTTTQRAWVAWRDAECAFTAAGVTGGSVYPTIYAGCLTDLTNDRAAEFRRFLSCEEGDLSCPLPPQ